MLIVLIRRIIGCRDVIGYARSWELSLFDEDVRDETVDDGWADWCIRSGPQHNTRSGKDLKRVKHSESSKLVVFRVGVS